MFGLSAKLDYIRNEMKLFTAILGETQAAVSGPSLLCQIKTQGLNISSFADGGQGLGLHREPLIPSSSPMAIAIPFKTYP
jgi:hypothetical protein